MLFFMELVVKIEIYPKTNIINTKIKNKEDFLQILYQYVGSLKRIEILVFYNSAKCND